MVIELVAPGQTTCGDLFAEEEPIAEKEAADEVLLEEEVERPRAKVKTRARQREAREEERQVHEAALRAQ